MKKHLVIKYFDTFPVAEFYFEIKEEAIKFPKEQDEEFNIYEYMYRGEY